jgi:ribonucleoside-diphosphate reductase alpha chain
LDRVIDRNLYPTPEAKASNLLFRPIGLGIMGLQDVFFQEGLSFDSDEALQISTEVSRLIFLIANETSIQIAKEKSPYPSWETSRDQISKRNSLLIAIAPTATISDLAGCYPSIEPQISNISKKETLSGDFIVVNEYLVEDLKKLDLWNDDIKAQIKLGEGSIQQIEEIPQELKDIYKTAWEISGKTLITLAAKRQPWIDQGQSLNLFMENPNIGALSSMYMYAWESNLKSTYYLRSRPATKIRKATVTTKTQVSEKEALICSLENPEACESCQ